MFWGDWCDLLKSWLLFIVSNVTFHKESRISNGFKASILPWEVRQKEKHLRNQETKPTHKETKVRNGLISTEQNLAVKFLLSSSILLFLSFSSHVSTIALVSPEAVICCQDLFCSLCYLWPCRAAYPSTLSQWPGWGYWCTEVLLTECRGAGSGGTKHSPSAIQVTAEVNQTVEWWQWVKQEALINLWKIGIRISSS